MRRRQLKITPDNFQERLNTDPNELFDTIYGIAEGVSIRVLGEKDSDIAQEAIQEAVLRVWEKREMIKTDNPFAYIYTMLKNRIIQYTERENKKNNTFLLKSAQNVGFSGFQCT